MRRAAAGAHCTRDLVFSVDNFVYRSRRGGEPTFHLPGSLKLFYVGHGAAGEELD